METSIIQTIKKSTGNLFEPHLLKSGTVLDVRQWEPGTMVEIDLHLPQADMSAWTEIPYIKVRVDAMTYRDYTPSGWDAETSTCTIFVDAAHQGAGSAWAKQLQKGNHIQYLKVSSSHHAPHPVALVVGLGDESSMGHLLALQQMVMPSARFCGAILLKEPQHRNLFHQYFKSPLQAIARKTEDDHRELFNWVAEQGYCIKHTVFCLTGNSHMVSGLRKLLRKHGYPSGNIQVKGFWS